MAGGSAAWTRPTLLAQLAYLVIGGQVLVYLGFNAALSRWPSHARVYAWTFLVPAVAVLVDAVRGTLPGLTATAGIILVIVGVAIVNHPRAEPSPVAAIAAPLRDGEVPPPPVSRVCRARPRAAARQRGAHRRVRTRRPGGLLMRGRASGPALGVAAGAFAVAWWAGLPAIGALIGGITIAGVLGLAGGVLVLVLVLVLAALGGGAVVLVRPRPRRSSCPPSARGLIR
jgi:hypothetical protein